MDFLGIHHIRFAVTDPSSFTSYLVNKFKFQYYAHHKTESDLSAVVLKHGGVMFVIDHRKSTDELLGSNENVEHSFCRDNVWYPVDTVCDVCFQCNYIDDIIRQVKASGKGACSKYSKVSDEDGTVSYAVLKSPFGNLQHTLVDLSQYHGEFLPGFNVDSCDPSKSYLKSIDHLAYVVSSGQGDNAVSWYNFVFGFERLLIDKDDLIEEGFEVMSGLMGMRLKAIHGMELCSVKSEEDAALSPAPVKLVFGEPLSTSNGDQISAFLEQHRGCGIQHIGLRTDNILQAVENFRELGAKFNDPPINYYNNITGLKAIDDLNVSLDDLQQTGILLESGNCQESDEVSLTALEEPWYILQVFTNNIFKEKTLFLELIQRHRTESGFGAGNIKALWDGVQAQLESLKGQ